MHMVPGTRYSLVVMAEIELTRRSELVGADPKKAALTIEEGISLLLLQLLADGLVIIHDVLITPPLVPVDGSKFLP